MSSKQATITQTKRALGEIVNLAPDAATLVSLPQMKIIKGFCKLGDFQVEEVAELVLKRYTRKHSQVIRGPFMAEQRPRESFLLEDVN